MDVGTRGCGYWEHQVDTGLSIFRVFGQDEFFTFICILSINLGQGSRSEIFKKKLKMCNFLTLKS